MPKQRETVFKDRVRRDLETLNYCWFVKIQQRSIRGIPDFLLCVSGAFVAIELKTDKGVLSKLQEWTLSAIANAQGLSFIVTPSNWNETFCLLQGMVDSSGDRQFPETRH